MTANYAPGVVGPQTVSRGATPQARAGQAVFGPLEIEALERPGGVTVGGKTYGVIGMDISTPRSS